MRIALPLALAALAAAPVLAQEAQSISFTCADGRVVEVAFPDAATAIIGIDGAEPVGLALIPPGAVSAGESGTDAAVEEAEAEAEALAEGEVVEQPRYAGNGLQWVADGTAAGTLSAEGDAADIGVVCTSAEPTEAEAGTETSGG